MKARRAAIATLSMAVIAAGGGLLAGGAAAGTLFPVSNPFTSAPWAPSASATDEPTNAPHSSRPTSSKPTPAKTTKPSNAPSTSTSPTTTPPTTQTPSTKPTANTDLADVQRRLAQLELYSGAITGKSSAATTTAIRHFQAKFGIAQVGVAGPQTVAKLTKLTANGSAIDPRCTVTGKTICVDKSQRILRTLLNGVVIKTVDVRFGPEESMPTREGAFTMYRKSRDHVSSEYGGPMPFAMFFSRGEAVHYSSDFAARGYTGNSHGCINVRDKAFVSALFDWAPIGTPVVVYAS